MVVLLGRAVAGPMAEAEWFRGKVPGPRPHTCLDCNPDAVTLQSIVRRLLAF